VIVVAHYDHLGVDLDGKVHPGADDNGSGVVALLALAEALAAHGPLECSVLLLWTSGEEKGLWGSQAFVADPCLPGGASPVACINLDMVGRHSGHQLSLTPFEESHPSYSELAALAADLAQDSGFTELESADEVFHRSDHHSFLRLGIPVVSFYDHMTADYHAPTDTPEKVDGDKIRRVVRLVLSMLLELQGDPAGRAR
jgi:Zn-dependent M28 family amino/carboxypeptidase